MSDAKLDKQETNKLSADAKAVMAFETSKKSVGVAYGGCPNAPTPAGSAATKAS